MNRDDAAKLLARVRGLFPKWKPTDTEIDLWADVFARYPEPRLVQAAIDDHKAQTRYATPTLAAVRELASVKHQSLERFDRQAPSGDPKPERFADLLRRQHEHIPRSASDADVLEWYHAGQVEQARRAYGRAFKPEEYRRSFRRDWQAHELAGGYAAECRVFGNTGEAEAFWSNLADTRSRASARTEAASIAAVMESIGTEPDSGGVRRAARERATVKAESDTVDWVSGRWEPGGRFNPDDES